MAYAGGDVEANCKVAGFKVLTAAALKSKSSEIHSSFKGIYCFHVQGTVVASCWFLT
jgi:hypothetical protein